MIDIGLATIQSYWYWASHHTILLRLGQPPYNPTDIGLAILKSYWYWASHHTVLVRLGWPIQSYGSWASHHTILLRLGQPSHNPIDIGPVILQSYWYWASHHAILFTSDTLFPQVRLGINQGKDFSRRTVEFNAEADPGSYVAFSGMLSSLYDRGLNDGITENEVCWDCFTHLCHSGFNIFHFGHMSETFSPV